MMSQAGELIDTPSAIAAPPDQVYQEKLKSLSDRALAVESEQKIWLSANAAGAPQSDYHWQRVACAKESRRRGQPQCSERAWRHAWHEAMLVVRYAQHPISLPAFVILSKTAQPLPIKVCGGSPGGFYIGTEMPWGEPYSRESNRTWPTSREAQAALDTKTWPPLKHLPHPPFEQVTYYDAAPITVPEKYAVRARKIAIVSPQAARQTLFDSRASTRPTEEGRARAACQFSNRSEADHG